MQNGGRFGVGKLQRRRAENPWLSEEAWLAPIQQLLGMSLLACLLPHQASLRPAQMLKCSNAHAQTPYPPLPPSQIFAKCNLFLQVGGKIFLFAVICVQAFSSKVINSSPLIFSCVIWIAPPWIGGIMWYFPLMPQLLNKNTHKFPMPATFQFVWSFSWIVYDEWQKHRSLASTGNHLKPPGGLSREHDLDCKREMRPQ